MVQNFLNQYGMVIWMSTLLWRERLNRGVYKLVSTLFLFHLSPVTCCNKGYNRMSFTLNVINSITSKSMSSNNYIRDFSHGKLTHIYLLRTTCGEVFHIRWSDECRHTLSANLPLIYIYIYTFVFKTIKMWTYKYNTLLPTCMINKRYENLRTPHNH